MTTVNVGTQTYPVGITNRDFALPAVSISSFSISADCSAWVLPGTLAIELFFSYDNGATYQHVVGITQNTPPPWAMAKGGGTSSVMQFGAQYTVPVQPTNARFRITVGGSNPISIGPSSITVS